MLSHLALVVCVQASRQESQAIDDFVSREIQARNIPGLVVIVARDGKVIKEAAYGVSNLEKKTPMKTGDLFDMGSIGKTFTATMIMQLVEENKLSLSDKLSKYVDGTPEAWKEITIQDLLSHQSGIPDYAFETGLGLADDSTSARWKEIMFKKPLDFQTGVMFQYSNSNYTLLGMVLESTTKKQYRDLLSERICKRVKIPVFKFRSPGKGVQGATGYFFEEGKFIDAGRGGSTEMPSDGGGFCRPKDLMALTNGFANSIFVKSDTLAAMQAPARTKSGRKTAYGYGWFVRSLDDNLQISHGGNSVGFSASMSTFPKQKLNVVLMGNMYPFSGDELALQLARVIDPTLLPKKLKNAESDPDTARTTKLRDALNALANAKLDSNLFHPDMRARLATGRGQMAVPAFAVFKDLESMKFIDARRDDPDTIIRYRAKSKTASYILEFALTDEGNVYSIGRAADPGMPS